VNGGDDERSAVAAVPSAACISTASNKPVVSVATWRLQPSIFFAASPGRGGAAPEDRLRHAGAGLGGLDQVAIDNASQGAWLTSSRCARLKSNDPGAQRTMRLGDPASDKVAPSSARKQESIAALGRSSDAVELSATTTPGPLTMPSAMGSDPARSGTSARLNVRRAADGPAKR
jgi:hypothetical protein